jgi:hypothetical protein
MGGLTIPCREDAFIKLASRLQASSWIQKEEESNLFQFCLCLCIYFSSRIVVLICV